MVASPEPLPVTVIVVPLTVAVATFELLDVTDKVPSLGDVAVKVTVSSLLTCPEVFESVKVGVALAAVTTQVVESAA